MARSGVYRAASGGSRLLSLGGHLGGCTSSGTTEPARGAPAHAAKGGCIYACREGFAPPSRGFRRRTFFIFACKIWHSIHFGTINLYLITVNGIGSAYGEIVN